MATLRDANGDWLYDANGNPLCDAEGCDVLLAGSQGGGSGTAKFAADWIKKPPKRPRVPGDPIKWPDGFKPYSGSKDKLKSRFH